MTRPDTSNFDQLSVRRMLFLCAAALQIICCLIFVADVSMDLHDLNFHALFEAVAVIGLAIGATLTLREYRNLLHRNTKVERELGVASGAFQEVINEHFRRWGLTAAESDVALFLIKGLSVADIAALRHTRDGTIKAQSASIYRKAGVSSRSELISVMVEELINGLSAPNNAQPNNTTQPQSAG